MGITLVAEDISMDAFKAMVSSHGDKMVVVDFFADWCGPCRMMGPILEQLDADHSDKVAIIKLNTDQCPSIPTALEIRALPTLLFYKNGEKVDELVGACSTSTLNEKALA